MPYIILTAHGEELERKELTEPVTIGRSPTCDLSVRDILLSRIHCRIERAGAKGRWKILDMASKNGTHFNWSRITEHTLADADAFRIGRSWLTFHSGAFVPSPADKMRKSKLVRPADPHEALSGTVSDFVYSEPDPAAQEFDGLPSPVRPVKPGSASIETGGTILREISSSWDSIVATASLPNRLGRPRPRPMPDASTGKAAVGKLQMRRRTDADLSLQLSTAHIPFLEVVPTLPRRRKANLGLAFALTFGVCIATALVLLSGWALSRG